MTKMIGAAGYDSSLKYSSLRVSGRESGRATSVSRFDGSASTHARKRLHSVMRKFRWRTALRSSQLLKRLVEVTIAASVLILFAPLFLIVAILIKLTDGGPILFRQNRVGEWGREFSFPKFRSMVTNAEKLRQTLTDLNDHGGGITFKMKRDPRVTWIGRIIRRFSIDEIPQLWCVLRGEMALVGPRPALPSEVARYTPRERRRLEIKPGLTCIWQVSGRSELPFHRQVELDIEYINSQCFTLDLLLILKTIPAVLSGRGAY